MKSFIERFEHNFDNAIMGFVGGLVFYIMVMPEFPPISHLLLRTVAAVIMASVIVGIYSLFTLKRNKKFN